MKLISSVIFFLVILIFGCEQSQDNRGDLNNKLVGTWCLIEFSDLDSLSGEWKYRYGKNPMGLFTYTKTGIVNLQITKEEPLKFSEDSAKHVVMSYYETANNSIGYFGTYSVDWEKSILTHHVTGGSLPWYIDTDQPRPFIMKGDTVIIGDNKTWKRVLVRAD